MSSMDGLDAFVLARLTEDEQVAQAAGGEPWSNGLPVTHYGDGSPTRTVLRPDPGFGNHVTGSIHAGHAEHIARHDPARELDEVAAKRRILVHCDQWLEQDDADHILGALALPYATHPDYRAEWAL